MPKAPSRTRQREPFSRPISTSSPYSSASWCPTRMLPEARIPSPCNDRDRYGMPQLILTTTGGTTRQVLLKPHENTLGRGAHNDIVIPSAEVSRQHAVITVEAAF